MTSEKHKTLIDAIPEEARAHYKQAKAEMRKSVEEFMPPGFVKHHRSARKEMLLAAREMLNFAISRIEEKDGA